MGAANEEAGAPPSSGLTQSEDARLRAEVDALLLDPRGRFRPCARVLRGAAGTREWLVMQVGEDAQRGICVVTPEPLPEAACWTLDDGTRVRVSGTRTGHRPEDADAPCWISVLRPID